MRYFRFAKPCLLCHEVQAAGVLCQACQHDLHALLRTQSYCPSCTQPRDNAEFCLGCQAIPPPYQYFWASANYVSPLPELLHQWKHAQQTAFSHIFQWIMQHNPPAWLPDCGADCLLPMPISTHRRWQRGFNQSDELARWLSRHYTLPILPTKTVLREHRAAQSTLNREQRYDNIQQIFAASELVKNRKILIIDDICTTKATITELASSLHQSGASDVFVWVVACSE